MANSPIDEPKFANAAERILYNKRRKFESKHQTLIDELVKVGHSPKVMAVWVVESGADRGSSSCAVDVV